MNCLKFEDYFSDYLEDALDPQIREKFEEHLSTCPKCAEHYARFVSTMRALGKLEKVSALHGFETRLQRRIATAKEKPRFTWKSWANVLTWRLKEIIMPSLGFTMAMLLLMIITFTWRTQMFPESLVSDEHLSSPMTDSLLADILPEITSTDTPEYLIPRPSEGSAEFLYEVGMTPSRITSDIPSYIQYGELDTSELTIKDTIN